MLILASMLLYVFVIGAEGLAERSESGSAIRAERPRPKGGGEPRAETANPLHTETVERAVTPSGIDTEGREEPPSAMGEPGETLFGIDLDSPFVVTGVITAWSLIALGLVWQARWALAGGMAWAALSVFGDAFELASKAREADWGLASAVVAVGVMHAGVVYLCFRAARQGAPRSA